MLFNFHFHFSNFFIFFDRYSWEQNRSWRFEHSYFYPDPLRGDFNVAGLNFQWGEEGIFGMALSPIRSDGYRTFYFSPLASHREFSVSTRILRDESRVEDAYHDFFFFPTERASNAHTTARVCSDDGIMLFNLIDQNAVGCWHTSMPYEPQYHGVVDRDDVGLVFPADVKVDENRNVWVLSDRMPVFLITNLDYNDVNFRIYSAPLQTLIGGTVCDISNRISSRFGLNSILSSASPTKSSLLTAGPSFITANPGLGLGAFKTIGTGAPSRSFQSLNNLQNLPSISPLRTSQSYNQNLQNLQNYQSIPNLQSGQSLNSLPPLLGYDVREPIAQTYTTKPVTSKAPVSNAYSFKGSTFGAQLSQTSADFTSGVQNLPKTNNWWTTQLW